MKSIFLFGLVSLQLFFLPLSAQEISVGSKPVWYYNISKDVKPLQMSCKAGESQYYRLHVSYPSGESDFISDTISTLTKELTEEDKKTLEEEFNKKKQELLDDLLDKKNAEQQEDFGPSLMDVLLKDCEDAFHELLDTWNTEDFFVCIQDCSSPIQDCNMVAKDNDRRVEDARLGYRLKLKNLTHSAERDEDAKPPYVVIIDYDLEYFSEAWVYFKVSCQCRDIPGYASVEPGSVNPPWDNISLTGERMKPGYPFTIVPAEKFPWVLGSVATAGVGALIYILMDEKSDDCAFQAMIIDSNATCSQANGSAVVVVSSASQDTYSYLWSNGSTDVSIDSLLPGVYSVTVTKVGTGCTAIVSTTIINEGVSFSTTFSAIDAHCGQHDGSASVNVEPPASYTYTWSNGGTGSSQSNLASGTYTVTVSAGGVCETSFDILIGELPPQFEINMFPFPASCGMADGSAFAQVTKGDYNFLWSNGQTGAGISDVPAGEYSVTVTINGTSCQKTSSVIIGEMPADFEVSFEVNRSSCGASDGSVTATVAEPGQYDFLWSTGTTTAELTGVPTGEYQVTVTLSGTQCFVTYSVQVPEEPADITVTFNTTPANCGVADGSATAIVSPPGEYTYSWSNGNVGAQLTGVLTGDYSVTVTRIGTTCAVSASVHIDETGANFSLNTSTTSAHCGIADGSASVEVAPPGTYTYAWSSGSTEASAGNLSPGEYTVSVTNTGGCTVVNTVTVAELPTDFIVDIQTVPGNCLGTGADIIITTQTYAGGPMEIIANGPDGIHVVTVPPGTTNLSASFIVLPGTWNITVRDVDLFTICLDSSDVVVDDNTVLNAMDDAFETSTNQPVSGNVLNNDSGIDLEIIDHTDPSGGMLVLNTDGSFTFTPPAGQAGQFTFQYTVGDTCGNAAFATVTINVTNPECIFNAAFTTEPSNCGLANGSITTIITPPGNYTFLWSNGVSSQDNLNISSGLYTVTVTSIDLNCNQTFDVNVGQVDNQYIESITTQAGNCTGEGEIVITLTTPGNGPLVVTIDGPDGVFQFTLTPGTHNLSSSMNIPSGTYLIVVWDQAAGKECAESIDITVPDNTPALVAVNDSYETAFGTPVSGNVLTNDTGLNISMTSVGQVVGGNVVFNANGSFTFTPASGFSGNASFNYTVTDACGTTATALVQILVGIGNCDFTVQFINTNASCGFEDGEAIAIVDPSGTYFYEWSNGSTGEVLSDIGAGTYTVTIEDVNLGCTLEFETEVGENPPVYISNIQIIQPVGGSPGEINFDVSSLGGGPFEITVTYPEGTIVFPAQQGTVMISDQVPVFPGDYFISVIDVNAGPDCVESFVAEIEEGAVMELGFGIMTFNPTQPLLPEQQSAELATILRSVLTMGLHYRVGGMNHETGIAVYRDGLTSLGDDGIGYRLEHLVEVWEKRRHGLVFKLDAGMDILINRNQAAECLVLKGRVERRFGRMMTGYGSFALYGWKTVERPVLEMGVRMPFLILQK